MQQLEVPYSMGDDPLVWLYCAQWNFEINPISGGEGGYGCSLFGKREGSVLMTQVRKRGEVEGNMDGDFL